MGKELKVRAYINFPDGRRILYDDLSPEEQKDVSEKLSIQFAKSLGYVPVRTGG